RSGVSLVSSFASSCSKERKIVSSDVSNCPQICTPTCPCSLQCTGPFGTTTCGAAGQACTPLTETPEDTIFLSFEQELAKLDTSETPDLFEAPVEPADGEEGTVETADPADGTEAERTDS
ncbi:MAG: hypothetical protein AAFY88_21910, partial [Acidobacteriota bacterium]